MKRVGVIRGGTGENYASSLSSGGDIILNISENLAHKFKVFDILIDKKGIWHISGKPIMPADLMRKVDLVWNVADPNISIILNSFSIPNITTSFFSNALQSSKNMMKEHMQTIGVNILRHIFSPKNAKQVFENFGGPWLVGDKLAKTFPQLIELIGNGQNVLVEEFIPGKVASVHSVPNFRKQEIYVFPPVNVFGKLSTDEKNKLSTLVKDLHHHLSAKHYLKSNFVLNKRGKVYLIDFDSTPNLKAFSHFLQACDSVGAKMHDVVEHILEGV